MVTCGHDILKLVNLEVKVVYLIHQFSGAHAGSTHLFGQLFAFVHLLFGLEFRGVYTVQAFGHRNGVGWRAHYLAVRLGLTSSMRCLFNCSLIILTAWLTSLWTCYNLVAHQAVVGASKYLLSVFALVPHWLKTEFEWNFVGGFLVKPELSQVHVRIVQVVFFFSWLQTRSNDGVRVWLAPNVNHLGVCMRRTCLCNVHNRTHAHLTVHLVLSRLSLLARWLVWNVVWTHLHTLLRMVGKSFTWIIV